MKSKKNKNQKEKRYDEVFDVTCKIMEVLLNEFNAHKINPVESFRVLNSIYTRVCDTLIEQRKDGISVEEVKHWILDQVDMLMGCIVETLPLNMKENEKKTEENQG